MQCPVITLLLLQMLLLILWSFTSYHSGCWHQTALPCDAFHTYTWMRVQLHKLRSGK